MSGSEMLEPKTVPPNFSKFATSVLLRSALAFGLWGCSSEGPEASDDAGRSRDARAPTGGNPAAVPEAGTDASPEPYCGDSIRQSNEECDDGNRIDVDSCQNDCTRGIITDGCGDGIHSEDELCDGSDERSVIPCTSHCKINVCGDGYLWPDEECDDGNRVTGDGCDECKATPCTLCSDAGPNDAGLSDTGPNASRDAGEAGTQPDACTLSCSPDGG